MSFREYLTRGNVGRYLTRTGTLLAIAAALVLSTGCGDTTYIKLEHPSPTYQQKQHQEKASPTWRDLGFTSREQYEQYLRTNKGPIRALQSGKNSSYYDTTNIGPERPLRRH